MNVFLVSIRRFDALLLNVSYVCAIVCLVYTVDCVFVGTIHEKKRACI